MNTQQQLSKRAIVRPITRVNTQDWRDKYDAIIEDGGKSLDPFSRGDELNNLLGIDFDALMVSFHEKLPFIIIGVVALLGIILSILAFVI